MNKNHINKTTYLVIYNIHCCEKYIDKFIIIYIHQVKKQWNLKIM